MTSPRGDSTLCKGGGASRRAPAVGAAPPAELFVSLDQLAERLGLSRGVLLAQAQAGLVPSITVGTRRLFPWPLWHLRALGISTPQQVGELCAGLGLRDMRSLLEWLSGDGGTP
jgi:hypothetical protein